METPACARQLGNAVPSPDVSACSVDIIPASWKCCHCLLLCTTPRCFKYPWRQNSGGLRWVRDKRKHDSKRQEKAHVFTSLSIAGDILEWIAEGCLLIYSSCSVTCIEGSEVSLETVFQEASQWLDVRYGTLPFCEEVLNHVMNCLRPW